MSTEASRAPISFTTIIAAKKVLAEFAVKLKGKACREKLLFGLFRYKVQKTFLELIYEGHITAEEADIIRRAQLIVTAFEKGLL